MAEWHNLVVPGTGQIVRTSFFQQLWDNIQYIAIPPSSFQLLPGDDNTAAFTTTSSAFANIDSVYFQGSITTLGEPILVAANIFTTHSVPGSTIDFDIVVDNVSVSGGSGVLRMAQRTGQGNIPFLFILTGYGAASHTIAIQWATSAATASLLNSFRYGMTLRAV